MARGNTEAHVHWDVRFWVMRHMTAPEPSITQRWGPTPQPTWVHRSPILTRWPWPGPKLYSTWQHIDTCHALFLLRRVPSLYGNRQFPLQFINPLILLKLIKSGTCDNSCAQINRHRQCRVCIFVVQRTAQCTSLCDWPKLYDNWHAICSTLLFRLNTAKALSVIVKREITKPLFAFIKFL
jgi:hypothetical protein